MSNFFGPLFTIFLCMACVAGFLSMTCAFDDKERQSVRCRWIAIALAAMSLLCLVGLR